MKKVTLRASLLLLSSLCFSQQKEMPEAEKKELGAALAEAGNSPLEFARVLERHLQKYPDSPQRDDLEKTLVKSAMEANDKKRILLWGERSLAKNMSQPLVLERVTRVLLDSEDKDRSERALRYAKKYEEEIRGLWNDAPANPRQKAQFVEEVDKAIGRALVLQSRATGNLGKLDDAAGLAVKAFDQYPTHEAAREAGRWLSKSGKGMEAARRYADAFMAPDSPAEMRQKDRGYMAESYRKEKGTEAGLGDLLLESFDRTVTLAQKRLVRLREFDPNTGVTNAMEYTLSALQGDALRLSSLKGKVIVMDFWATWCGPCKVQHPLYEDVKKKFANNADVVFLAVNTDEEISNVGPFLDNHQWGRKVYFEDGLSNLLKVSSIPTTIVFGRNGQVSSRMNGFVPEKFVDQLTARISEALSE